MQELASSTPTANLLTGLGIDEYLVRTDAAGARHFLTDALGSTVALADGSGTVQTEYTYEPFGTVTTSGAGSSNTFGFTGRENGGTGLNYYRARYYDPRLQRFVAEDPIGFDSGDTNLHAYVANSPINLVDPSGLCPLCMAFGWKSVMTQFPRVNQAPRTTPRPSAPPTPRSVPRPPPGWRELTEPTQARRYGPIEWWERLMRKLDDLRDQVPDPTDVPTSPPAGRKPPNCKDVPPIRSLSDLYSLPLCRM